MVVSTDSKTYPWDNPFSSVKVQMAAREDAPQWMRDLEEQGWAVVKGAVPPERAADYASKAHAWLEGFNLGYKRDDPSTWEKQNLPRHVLGGLYSQYSIAHAQFVWDIKSEPGIVSLYEQIWGTDKLTVSFDGGNLAVPLPKDQIDNKAAPWPHSDQSPLKPGLEAVQGLLNLLPNGPDDGGLTVMTGSAKLFGATWEAFDHEKPAEGWSAHDNIKHDDAKIKWLESKGCKIVKPCLDPGDFILWDSRTVHYGQAPLSNNHRFAIYVCYKPFDWMTEEARQRKVELFNKGWCTSHDPCNFIPKREQDSDWNINFPYGRPKLSDKALKAVGVIPY